MVGYIIQFHLLALVESKEWAPLRLTPSPEVIVSKAVAVALDLQANFSMGFWRKRLS